MVNCNFDDDLDESHSHRNELDFKIKSITIEDVVNNQKALSRLINPNLRFDKKNKFNSKIISDTINNFTIETEGGTFIEYQNYHSYTFKVLRTNGSNYLLENIVVSKDGDKEYETYLYQYNITETELDMLKQNVSIDLSSKIIRTSLENSNIISDIFNKEDYNGMCFVESTTYTPGQNCPNGHSWEYVLGGSSCEYIGYSNGPWPGSYTTSATLQPCPSTGGTSSTTGTVSTGSENTSGGSYSTGTTSTVTTTPTFEDCEDCEIFTDPCQSLNNLINPNKGNIMPVINSLLLMAGNPTQNQVENGFSFKKEDNGTYNNPTVPNQNEAIIDMPEGPNIYGGIHFHPEILGNMFSWSDIYQLIEYSKKVKPELRSEVVFMLMTGEGNVYALKFTSIRKLNDFLLAQFNNVARKYPTWNNNRIIEHLDTSQNDFKGDKTDVERAFLEKYSITGLQLYQLDISNQTPKWKQIILPSNPSDSILPTIDCN